MSLLFLIVLSICKFTQCKEPHYIFCNSDLLHEVQLREVFCDPEEFLRLKLLKPQREILYDYKKLKLTQVPIPERKNILKEFVKTNFQNISGLESWIPADYKKTPSLIKKVRDKKLIAKLKQFNLAWLEHGRKLTRDVFDYPDRYSFIPVPRPFFVSSDNGYEMGYWESFWIFKGLLACDMTESAKYLMENIFSIIRKLGYCPPYNRVYYRDRSSPPMLPFMMSDYLERTNDRDFLEQNIVLMDSDLTVWVRKRFTYLQSPFHAFLIVVDEWWPQLRPEKYKDDTLSLMRKKLSLPPRQILWETNDQVLQTSVLLTAITEASARLMVPWLREYGYIAKARYFESVSKEMNYTLQNLFKVGDCYRDLHIDEGYKPSSVNSFSPKWLGSSEVSCALAGRSVIATTGPGAVIAGGEQEKRWISDFCRVKVDNLVDMSSAFHISRKLGDVSLEVIPKLKPANPKPYHWLHITLAHLLIGIWMAWYYKS